MASDEQVAEMRKNYEGGNYGYGHAKQALFELIVEKYAKERELYNHYMENIDELHKKLEKGEEKAAEIASKTLGRVRKVLGY